MAFEDRNESRNHRRVGAIAAFGLVLALLPACSASAGHGLFRRSTGDAAGQVQPYVAYRPAYPLPRTKALYLSNYAGANYPSVAPGAVVSPTDFRVLTGRPVRPWWAGLGQGEGW